MHCLRGAPCHVGQPFHQQVWEERHAKEIQDFTSQATRKAAQFNQLLARLFLATSEHPVDHEEILSNVNKFIAALLLPGRRCHTASSIRYENSTHTTNSIEVPPL